MTRVTRLGEFSPIGRLFLWVVFVKITEVAQIKWATFTTVTYMYVEFFGKIWIGQHFGRLFQSKKIF
jgi:hypothetical protein